MDEKANAPLNIYDFDQRFGNKDKLALTIKIYKDDRFEYYTQKRA